MQLFYGFIMGNNKLDITLKFLKHILEFFLKLFKKKIFLAVGIKTILFQFTDCEKNYVAFSPHR